MIDVATIAWVFIDVGSTLVDESAALHERFYQLSEHLRGRGLDISPERFERAYMQAQHDYVQSAFVRACDMLGIDHTQLTEAQVRWPKDLEKPYPCAGEVLRRLASRFKVGIIANQPLGTHQRLRDAGWGEYLSLCISSAEENLHKPDPAIYRLALERGKCDASRAVMVGDRIDNDIVPAKAVGMYTVRVRQGPSAVQVAREGGERADVEVASICEVPAVLGC